MLPGGIGVQCKHQLAHPTHPVPAPALHAEDRHHAQHTRREQRQRIKGTLADRGLSSRRPESYACEG